MDVESVDSVESSDGFFDSDEVTHALDRPLWFGREVQLSTEKNQKLQLLAQFFFANLQRMEEILNLQSGEDRFHIIDFQEEILEEITSNLDQYADFVYSTALYHPMNRNFAVLDPKNYQTDIVHCKNYIKSIGKGIGKGAKKIGKVGKKVGKGVAHVAKDVVHFVKEHPVEVAIGIVVVGVGLGEGFALSSLAQTAGAAAVAAAAAAPGTGRRREDEDGPNLSDPIAIVPPKDPAPLSSFLSDQEKAHIEKSNPFSGLSAGSSVIPNIPAFNQTTQFQNGISSAEFLKPYSEQKNNQPINEITAGSSSPFNIPEYHNQVPLQNVISGFFAKAAHGVCNTVAATRPYIPDALIEPFAKSCRVETEGIEYRYMRIGFINGMNNSYEDCMRSLEYIKTFVGDMKIEGVYNHSNSFVGDLAEILLLNYGGVAPVTAELLIENWTRFHEENKDNPDAKYLQITHSMGTILTKDALQKIPKEIRNRVIVVAIGPAIVIPENLCYDADHYASKQDIVHLGENLATLAGANLLDDVQRAEVIRKFEENKNRLILLDPHANYKKGLDHELESPTFFSKLGEHTGEYLQREGQYK